MNSRVLKKQAEMVVSQQRVSLSGPDQKENRSDLTPHCLLWSKSLSKLAETKKKNHKNGVTHCEIRLGTHFQNALIKVLKVNKERRGSQQAARHFLN